MRRKTRLELERRLREWIWSKRLSMEGLGKLRWSRIKILWPREESLE